MNDEEANIQQREERTAKVRSQNKGAGSVLFFHIPQVHFLTGRNVLEGACALGRNGQSLA